MKLAEIEALARDLATDDTGDTNEREWKLARFIVVAMPVVRAAEAYVRGIDNEEQPGAFDLAKAVDKMRAALEAP